MKKRYKDAGVTIGADPEFGLLDGGGIACAGDVLSQEDLCYRDHSGDCGCSQEEIDNGDCSCGEDECECAYTAIFGLDGSHDVFELRPRPNTNPLLVYDSVREALRRAHRSIGKGYRWQAGSLVATAKDMREDNGGFPIGGHVHFGHEKFRHTRDGDLRKFAHVLDYYLALPILAVEDPDRDANRSNDYGGWSDIRSQNHGFEYRTLPSWLVSPMATKAVLCLSKVLGDNMVTNLKSLTSGIGTIPRRDNHNSIRLEAIRARALCRKLPGFSRYAKHIEPLFKLGDKGRLWYPNSGMKAAWKISKPTAEEKRALMRAAAEEAKAAEAARIRRAKELEAARAAAALTAKRAAEALKLKREAADKVASLVRTADGFDGTLLLSIGSLEVRR